MAKQPFVKLSLTTPHLEGDEVRAAQHALRENSYENYHPGRITGRYDEQTAHAARLAKYMLGFPKRTWKGPERFKYGHKLHLTLTGERKLNMIQRRRRARRLARIGNTHPGPAALALAVKQVGTKESPPDSNLTKYGAWYGVQGQPWCAIFVSWCFAHSTRWWSKSSGFRYAYVPFVVNDARAGRNGLSIVTRDQVKPGDLVCFDWPGESPGTADHIGFFRSWVNKTSGTFNTIEGNTSLSNQSNGGEVMARIRDVGLVQAFVRVTTI